MRQRATPDDYRRARELRRDGRTLRAIAKELGFSLGWVRNHTQGIPVPARFRMGIARGPRVELPPMGQLPIDIARRAVAHWCRERYQHAGRASRYMEPREGGCIVWLAHTTYNGHPQGRVYRHGTHSVPRVVAAAMGWDIVGRRVMRTCSNDECISPLHLEIA